MKPLLKTLNLLFLNAFSPRSLRLCVSRSCFYMFLSAIFPISLLSTSAFSADSQSFDTFHQQSCLASDCHEQRYASTEGQIRHLPYLEQQCLTCHTNHSGSAPKLLRTGVNELCLSCHTEVKLSGEPPALAHPPQTTACTECHHPHASHVRNLLLTEERLGDCAACHADFLKAAQELPFKHKFFDPVNQCGNCHYAHSNPEDHYLRGNVAESCLTCHDLPIKTDRGTLENVGRALREAPVIHEAMKGESCATCHTPHGSVQPALLLPGYPAGSYATYEREQFALCWECHNPELAESETPSVTDATQFRDGEKNLHRTHLMELKRGRACHLCHEPHVSQSPHLMRRSVTFKDWVSPLKFEAMPDGGRCDTPCHRPKEYKR